jgi:hypothetical protein
MPAPTDKACVPRGGMPVAIRESFALFKIKSFMRFAGSRELNHSFPKILYVSLDRVFESVYSPLGLINSLF